MKKLLTALLSSALILTGAASSLAAMPETSGTMESTFLSAAVSAADYASLKSCPHSENCPNLENCSNNGIPPRDGSGMQYGANADQTAGQGTAANCPNNGNPPRDGSGMGFKAGAGNHTGGKRQGNCQNR